MRNLVLPINQALIHVRINTTAKVTIPSVKDWGTITVSRPRANEYADLTTAIQYGCRANIPKVYFDRKRMGRFALDQPEMKTETNNNVPKKMDVLPKADDAPPIMYSIVAVSI